MFDDIPLEQPFEFSKHTTIGCGGRAKQAFYPRDEDQLCALVARFGKQALILGNGSNILPRDEDTDKRVICTKKMTGIRITPKGIYVEAGESSGRLIQWMQSMGYSGVEFLAGIPCTLGGILFMNGGAGGQYIVQTLHSVRIYREGGIIDLPISECGYGYKESVFMQTGDVILGGVLRLATSTPQKVKEETQKWLAKRAHLPKGKSMGCVFKNPPNHTAGKLIEEAGLKGLRVGGAVVSNQHANFIINDNGATAKDICILIAQIKEKVWQRYAIRLEEEIRYL